MEPTATSAPSRDIGLWRQPGFGKLWGAVTAANLADGVTLAAVPLAAAALTSDPALIAGTVVAQRLPWLLFSLPAGVLVDRLDRRLLLVSANLLRALALGLFAVTLEVGVDGSAGLALLYGAGFLVGSAETVADNSSIAITPALVPREHLDRANGRIFAAMPVANELVGPPVGAWLFAVAAAWAFSGSAAAFAVAGVLALALRGTFRVALPPERPRRAMRAEVAEGLRWFAGNRVVRAAALEAAGSNLLSAATGSILIVLAQDRLGLDAQGFGFFLATAAVGGILGGWLADRTVAVAGPGPTILLSMVVPAVGFAIIALTRNPLVAGGGLALGSFAAMLGNVVTHTLRQRAVPDHLLGRVTSAYRLVGLGALPIGGLLGGIVARYANVTAVFWMAAAGMLVLAALIGPILTTANLRAAEAG